MKKLLTVLLIVVAGVGSALGARHSRITADVGTRHQVLDGFGSSIAWYEQMLPEQPYNTELYELMFRELGIDILRYRNLYDQGKDENMADMAEIFAAGQSQACLDGSMKLLACCWTPPAYLKSNGSLFGGTLIGGPGNYDYAGFADWWADSITAWAAYDVRFDYISVQNEPDYSVATHDTCRLNPTEDSSCAGFDQAFDAVYNELNSRFGAAMPKMLGPEVTGLDGIAGNSPSAYQSKMDASKAYGYAHHLYNTNPMKPGSEDPDRPVKEMIKLNDAWGNKPLWMTEYGRGTRVWPDALNMAHLLHNSLVHEEMSAYFDWPMVWGASDATAIILPALFKYTVNNRYYGLKHFAAFTDPGWQRVETTSNKSKLKISAFISPDNQELSVMLVNIDTADISTKFSLTGYTPASGGVFLTTQTKNCIFSGPYTGNSFTVPARSIMTLKLSTAAADSTAPAAPASPTAFSTKSQFAELDWASNGEADLAGYNVYRSTTRGSGYTKLNSDVMTSSAYEDTTVTNNTTYYYVITAVDIHQNESLYSTEMEVIPTPEVNLVVNPGFETGTTAGWGSFGGSSISAVSSPTPYAGSYCVRSTDRTDSWKGIKQDMKTTMLDGETYYVSAWVRVSSSNDTVEIDMRKVDESNGGNHTFETIGSVPANNTGWTQITAAYRPMVTGTLSALELIFKDTPAGVDIFVDDLKIYELDSRATDSTAPAAPTGVTATSVAGGQIDLGWTANAEPDLSGYKVYRSKTDGGPYTLIDWAITTNAYFDASVSPGTTYYYVITAGDIYRNESARSAEVNAVLEAPPAVPAGLGAAPGVNVVGGQQ